MNTTTSPSSRATRSGLLFLPLLAAAALTPSQIYAQTVAAAVTAQPRRSIAVLQPQPTAAPATIQFPYLNGSDAQGHGYSFPANFEGAANLAVIAFGRGDADAANRWSHVATQAGSTAGRPLRVFELQVPERRSGISRLWRGSGSSESIASTRTVILHSESSALKAMLGVSRDAKVAAVLVSQEGGVLWRAEGLPSTSTVQEVLAAARAATGTQFVGETTRRGTRPAPPKKTPKPAAIDDPLLATRED